MKKLALTLAAALMVVTIGCGDSKPPVVTYVARSNSEGVPPQVYTLNEATGQSTALSIAIPADAFSVSTNRDASKVLYVRDGDSGWDVFLMGADGVEHQLTTGADAWGPVFSPDGKKIAFMSYQSVNYQIYTMNADGSGSTPLFVNTDIEQDFPVFTADGKSLVFNVWIGCNCAAAQRHAPAGRGLHQPPHALKAQNHSATKANAAAITQNGFYKMALSDSAPTLTYATDEWWGPTALTQNGKGIIFTMYDGTEDNIFKVNLDGSALTPLTTDTTTYDFAPISYKNLILFNRYNSDNSSGDIYVMDQDGANQKLVHSTDSTYEMLVDAYWD